MFSMSGCVSINRNSWKTSAVWLRPVIQMTVIMNALGSAVSTQIVRPFLAQYNHFPTNTTLNGTISMQTVADEGLEPVQVVYLVVGTLDVGMAFVCVITCVWLSSNDGRCCSGLNAYPKDAKNDGDNIPLIPDNSDSESIDDDEDDKLSDTDQTLKPCSRQGLSLLVIILLFQLVNQTHNSTYMFVIFIYVYEYRDWSVNASTAIVMANQLTRFFVGVVMVPVSRWVSPTKLLMFNLYMQTVSVVSLVMALVLGDTYTAVGIVLQGAGTSNVFPTAVTLLEESIHVVAPLMSLFFTTVGVSVIVGFIIGTLLSYVGDWVFPVAMLTLVLISVVIFIAYKVISACCVHGRRHKSVKV